jgi:molybdopterin synthase catalytic subunit
MARTIRIQVEPFDVAPETAALTDGRADIGAVVAFTGLCRDEGGRLAALELEHYPGMA